MLVLHILIAITSIIVALMSLLRPSTISLRASYALTGLTVVSGAGLVFAGYDIVHACMSGLAVTVLTGALSLVARRKLAAVIVR